MNQENICVEFIFLALKILPDPCQANLGCIDCILGRRGYKSVQEGRSSKVMQAGFFQHFKFDSSILIEFTLDKQFRRYNPHN